MAQINTAMFNALRAAGYTGALTDMRRAFMVEQGFSTMRELYEAKGFTSGHISDFALEFWAAGLSLADVGDLVFTADTLGLPWLPVNATYSATTYPDLAALYTVTADQFTVPDQDGGGYNVYIYSGVAQ